QRSSRSFRRYDQVSSGGLQRKLLLGGPGGECGLWPAKAPCDCGAMPEDVKVFGPEETCQGQEAVRSRQRETDSHRRTARPELHQLRCWRRYGECCHVSILLRYVPAALE